MAEGELQYWKGENYELELSKFLLSEENMALRSEMKSLRNLLNESTKLIDDIEYICQTSAAMAVPNCACTVKNNIKELKLEVEHRLSMQKIRQDLHEKETTIKLLKSLTQEQLVTIEELRTNNKDLKVQIEKAMVFGEPHVVQPMAGADLGELPHSNVESADVEEEEEIKQKVQTKSWWRRQANKLVKGMGTFRLHCLHKCCFGMKTQKITVVQPVNSKMDIGMGLESAVDMLPASSGMPEVSV